jgi:hypothetical protein
MAVDADHFPHDMSSRGACIGSDRMFFPPTGGKAVARLTRCFFAGVAELVDALDLGSSDESCGGSSPSARTTSGSNLGGRAPDPRHPFAIATSLANLFPTSCLSKGDLAACRNLEMA